MPSGSKKRKAAKKKKESGAHGKLPGIDEVKTQESDGSGLSTPVSQDRDSHQSPFDVGSEDLDKTDPSPVFSTDSDSMDAEKVVSEGAVVVEVVRELNSQRGDENKIISIEHVQSVKGPLDKGGNSSSSSSSDDESQDDEKKENEEEPSFTDLVSEQVNRLIEKVAVEEVSGLHCKDDISSSRGHSDDESPVHEKIVPEEACNLVVEEPSSNNLVPEEVSQPRKEAPIEDVVDTVEPVVSVFEEEIHVKECVSVQNSVAAELTFSVLNGEASSDVVRSDPEKSECKVVSSSHSSSERTGNGTEHTKNSEILQYPDNENQLPVMAPRPVQTTSWKGCCGLFEVLIGSSR